jgi:acyl-CoA dehydrogenase
VFFDNYKIPADSLIGKEGDGFKIILHGMNAERCLLAGEALGLGYAALAKASAYARDRKVFNRPIGMNQGIAHPLADAYMRLEAAKLATYHAARLFDASKTDETVRNTLLQRRPSRRVRERFWHTVAWAMLRSTTWRGGSGSAWFPGLRQ